MLGLESGSLESLTFLPIYSKMGIDKNRTMHSRILSGLVEKHRKYCPACLKMNRYYKLIWQIKEINYCNKHNCRLLNICLCCNRKIAPIPNNSQIGYCPYCGADLSEFKINPPILCNEQNIINDWIYLIDDNKQGLNPVHHISNEQSLALKLIYLASAIQENALSKYERNRINTIKQIARESKSTQTFVHLDTILMVTRKANISLENFFKLTLPDEFVNTILMKRETLVNKYSCIAPWCANYHIPGSLKRTATSKKIYKDGSEHHYYMYCSQCGIEYQLIGRKLFERTDFIRFSWSIVKSVIFDKPYSLSELANKINAHTDKTRRSIIYLAANNLIDHQNVPLSLPKGHDPEILSKFKQLIAEGTPAKQIKVKLEMKYNDFLFYWFHPEVTIAYITKKTLRKQIYKDTDHRINDVLRQFYQNDIPITIKRLCEFLNVCPETLRLWGCLPIIKKHKQEQKERVSQLIRKLYIEKANEYASNAVINNLHVSSDEIYKYLGRPRTSMVRDFPDITAYISNLLKQVKV